MIFVFLPKCHSCVQRLPLLTAEISEFTIGGPCLTYRSCHISLFVYRVGEWKGRGGVQTQNLQHCKGRNNCHSPTSIQKLSGCDNIMQCTTNLYEIWLWIHLIDHVESRYAYIWRSNTPPPSLSLSPYVVWYNVVIKTPSPPLPFCLYRHICIWPPLTRSSTQIQKIIKSVSLVTKREFCSYSELILQILCFYFILMAPFWMMSYLSYYHLMQLFNEASLWVWSMSRLHRGYIIEGNTVLVFFSCFRACRSFKESF